VRKSEIQHADEHTMEFLFFDPLVLVTQRIYSRFHSFTQHFVFTAFDMHRYTTLARKLEGNIM